MLETTIVSKRAADEVNVNVTRCEYAEFFSQLGEPELGFLLECSLDHDIADGAGLALERFQTTRQSLTGSDSVPKGRLLYAGRCHPAKCLTRLSEHA